MFSMTMITVTVNDNENKMQSLSPKLCLLLVALPRCGHYYFHLTDADHTENRRARQ